jgi:hypothetical protein
VRAADYRRAADDITAFLNAYSEFVACLRPVPGYREVWEVKPGAEERLQSVMPRVARAAGRAALAFQNSGHSVDYKPPGTWQRTSMNPALVWSTLLDDYPIVTPSLLVTIGSQAIGTLESLHDEAAERERGVAGLLARFVRFPVRVREAAGLPSKSVSGGLLSGVVALFQGLFVTALGGALVYPLVHWLGWTPG